MVGNLLEPGWESSLFQTFDNKILLTIHKTKDNDTTFERLKEGKSKIIITKKTKRGLKYIHSFHGSEAEKYSNYQGALEFIFPKKFFIYFNHFGLEKGQQRQYVVSIYPENIETTDFLEVMKYYYALKYN